MWILSDERFPMALLMLLGVALLVFAAAQVWAPELAGDPLPTMIIGLVAAVGVIAFVAGVVFLRMFTDGDQFAG